MEVRAGLVSQTGQVWTLADAPWEAWVGGAVGGGAGGLAFTLCKAGCWLPIAFPLSWEAGVIRITSVL